MMRKFLPLVVTLLIATSAVWAAPAQRTALVKLPTMGRASAAVTPLQKTLEAIGFSTTVPLALTPVSSMQPQPTLVIAYQSELDEEPEAKYVRDAVKQGMGLLYLYGTAPERVEAANAFLKETGVQLAAGEREGRNIRITALDLVPGVAEAPAPRIALKLEGPDLQVIATQQDRPLVAGVAFGKGRIVALPVDVLSGARSGEPPVTETLALMAGCARWACGLAAEQVPTVTAQQPLGVSTGTRSQHKEGKPAPPSVVEAGVQVFGAAADFKDKTLVDIGAADDGWLTVAQELAPVLQLHEATAVGLKTQGVKEPLLAALRSGPSCVVLGSCREFSDAEAVALEGYISAGGRAIILAHASDATISRLISLNNVLLSFGVVAGLGRERGPALFEKHAALDAVTNPGVVPSGVRLTSAEADPLATVNGDAFAMAGQARNGRFLIVDAGGLLVQAPKGQKTNPARDAYVEFLRGLITWVTAK